MTEAEEMMIKALEGSAEKFAWLARALAAADLHEDAALADQGRERALNAISRAETMRRHGSDLLGALTNMVRWAQEPSEDAVGMAREQKWLSEAIAAIKKSEI